MERILVLFYCLISWSAFAATPGTAPVLTIAAPGSQTQAVSIPLSSLSGSGLNGVFSLYATGTTGGNYYPFFKNGVAYQVGSSAKAYCFNFRVSAQTAAQAFQLMSATATFSNGSTTVTGGVFGSGTAATYNLIAGPTISLFSPIPGEYVFGSSSWPGFQDGLSGSSGILVNMECFEQ